MKLQKKMKGLGLDANSICLSRIIYRQEVKPFQINFELLNGRFRPPSLLILNSRGIFLLMIDFGGTFCNEYILIMQMYTT